MTKQQKIEPKLLQTKSFCYTIVKNAPRVLLTHSEAEKRKLEIFDFVIFLSSFFFSFITRNSKTIGRIRKFYVSQTNALLTKRCLFWVRAVCEPRLAVIIQNMHGGLLLRRHFVCTFAPKLTNCRAYTSILHTKRLGY